MIRARKVWSSGMIASAAARSKGLVLIRLQRPTERDGEFRLAIDHLAWLVPAFRRRSPTQAANENDQAPINETIIVVTHWRIKVRATAGSGSRTMLNANCSIPTLAAT